MTIKTVAPQTTYFKGDHRGVILMHAYTGSPNDVRLLGRFLNSQGYSVYMPLFSGHGTNRPEDILDAGVKSWQADLEQSIAFMRAEGFHKIAIFGLSLGGVFAMKAIEDYPDYIIGGGPFCSPIIAESKTNIVPSFIAYVKAVMTTGGTRDSEQAVRLPVIKEQLQQQLAEIQRFTKDVFTQLPTITQPTLLVQAGQDKMIDPQDVYTMAKQLVASDAEVKWYPKSGHVITIGSERQLLQEDVLTFLNNLTWQID